MSAPELLTFMSDGYKITLIFFVCVLLCQYAIVTLIKCFNFNLVVITAKLLWDVRSRKKKRCMKNLHNLPEDMDQFNQLYFDLESSSRNEKTCQDSHHLCEYKLFLKSVYLSQS